MDTNEGDKEFRKLQKKIIYSLKVQHVEPEEIVIRQSDSIMNDDVEPVEYDTERAKFYIILNGNFKVSNLRFNARKK